MKKYIATGFDNTYWTYWGASWLTSLKDLAKYEGEIIIIDYNLSSSAKAKIKDMGVNLIPSTSNKDSYRYNTIRIISELAKKENAIFAYWDADVYFQDKIDEIFDLAKSSLVVSENLNSGFIAGPSSEWNLVRDACSVVSFFKKSNIHEYILNSSKVKRISNTWNFVEMPQLTLVNDQFVNKDIVQKVIHPCGEIKSLLPKRNILFWEKHKDLYEAFVERKINTGTRILIGKNSLSNTKKVLL